MDQTNDAAIPSTTNHIKYFIYVLMFLILSGYFLSIYWSIEPEQTDVHSELAYVVRGNDKQRITGYTMVNTLVNVMETLLNKPGGFLGNDIIPPSLMMDNMPAFEYGALVQSRDLVRTLRKEFSRSQSQSTEQIDLKVAEPKFYIAHKSWALPSAEGEYRDGIKALKQYRNKLADPEQSDTQFYARADNLGEWLGEVSNRLGSYSQRLTASVGQERIDTNLAGDSSATQSTSTKNSHLIKTPWLKIDDIYYEARGASWALAQFLKAVEVDFADVLAKKNAQTSLKQIIRELEATQETVWSPMILNGSGFGFVANHSLVMASYISRANAGLIDLKELLSQG